MPGSAAKLVITERQQALLQQIVAASTSPVRLVQRAEIILRAFAGQENREIAAAIDLNPTVLEGAGRSTSASTTMTRSGTSPRAT
jgi:hypothetical protein